MTSLNNGRIIKISIGNVNQPIVEDIVNEEYLDTAVFGEQYRNMLSMLNLYVKNPPRLIYDWLDKIRELEFEQKF